MATLQRARAGDRSPAESLQEYGRGVAGGLIFSLPLLFTMEVWELGAAMSPARLLVGLGATVLLLIGYNRYAGLRRDAGWSEVLIDSIEELGLGLLVAALVLWLLGQISPEMRPGALARTVVLEGLLAAIGVSVGTAQLGGGGANSGTEAAEGDDTLGGRLALGACGATLIAANVAPTEEILIIAGAANGWRLLAMAALAIGLSAMIIFYADFVGSEQRPGRPEIWREVVGTYAVALVAAAALLWFFERLDGQPPEVVLSRIVVLSVPAALGASAGRLLLQGGGDS